MIIEGVIKTKNNVSINEQTVNMIIELFESLKLEYVISANICNGSTINFDDKNELFLYDNFYESRIVNLQIRTHGGFLREENLAFDINLNKGIFDNIESTIVCRYTINSKDDAKLRNDILRIFSSCKDNLSWITQMFPIIYLVFILLLGVLGYKQLNSFSVGVLFVVSFAALGVLSIMMNFLYYFVIPVKFQFGKMKDFYSNREKLSTNVFWGIIVTTVLSIIINKLL